MAVYAHMCLQINAILTAFLIYIPIKPVVER